LVVRGRRVDWALASLSYAALVLTHNITALVATPLLMAYGVVLWVSAGRDRDGILRLASAFLLGLGLTAFFWVPALLEEDYVQIHQLFAPADLDFHNNFSTLGELLALPRAVDPHLINHPAVRSLGLPQLLLAVWAVGASWWKGEHGLKVHVLFLGILAVGLVVMILPISLPIWESVALLRFVQFPWRFLGLASLFLAVLAGVGAARMPLPDVPRLLVVQAVVTLYALTWLFPRYLPDQAAPSPLDLIEFEQVTGALGTTSAGDFLPIWVRTLPAADSLASDYEAAAPHYIIPRLRDASLPTGATVTYAAYGLTSADLVIDSPVAFPVTFNWYFFPGWWGWLDDEPLELGPVGDEGLVGAEIPAGQHHIVIQFGQTLVRNWSGRASIASLGAILILLALWRPGAVGPALVHRANLWLVRLSCAGLAVGLFAFKVGFLDSHESWARRTAYDGETVVSAQVPLNVDFGGQLELLGYDVSMPGVTGPSDDVWAVPADGLIDVSLYWCAVQELDVDYSVAVHLVDEQGRRYGQDDSQHPAGYPTSRWELGTYGYDQHRVSIWPGTPPGEYEILVSVYDVATDRSLNVDGTENIRSGSSYVLGSLVVVESRRPVLPSDVSAGEPMLIDLGRGIQIVGIVPPPQPVNAGGYLPFTLFWYAHENPADDYLVRMRLVDESGVSSAEEVRSLGRASFPTSAWRMGEFVRDGHSFAIPAEIPGGNYLLRVDLLDAAREAVTEAVTLLDVSVRSPDRVFDVPVVEYSSTARIEGLAQLLGYDLAATSTSPGETTTITLYWQATASVDTSYVVFVHLLDTAGRLVTGSDLVPAGGSRPTTGWVAGEVITDPHDLSVPDAAPSGRYRIEVGVYDPHSGDRLSISDGQGVVGDDHLILDAAIEVD